MFELPDIYTKRNHMRVRCIALGKGRGIHCETLYLFPGHVRRADKWRTAWETLKRTANIPDKQRRQWQGMGMVWAIDRIGALAHKPNGIILIGSWITAEKAPKSNAVRLLSTLLKHMARHPGQEGVKALNVYSRLKRQGLAV